jgi:hypothetical protein
MRGEIRIFILSATDVICCCIKIPLRKNQTDCLFNKKIPDKYGQDFHLKSGGFILKFAYLLFYENQHKGQHCLHVNLYCRHGQIKPLQSLCCHEC